MGNLAQSSAGFGGAATAFWVTGLCGGVTTFSALCADAIGFARRGQRTRVVVVLLANTILSIAGLMLGLAITSSRMAA
jgi:fluoride ion exporter CrcB/FEX